MQVLWPRRHHKGTPRLLKSFEAIACPLAAARRKERAHSTNTKARRTARARARTRTRRTVPRTKKPPKAQARARSPTRVHPVVGKGSRKERRVQRHVVRRAYCRRARASERKKSRVGRLFVSLLKNARAADILHILHFENLRRQVLVLSTESRSVSEVGCFWGGSLAGHLVSCQVSQVSCEEHRCSRPRMEALVQDFQQFAAKVRWK